MPFLKGRAKVIFFIQNNQAFLAEDFLSLNETSHLIPIKIQKNEGRRHCNFQKAYLCPPFEKSAFKMGQKPCSHTALANVGKGILRTTIQ
ncbi:MAG: hypothetical protein IPM82_16875 [Saprospiraceae bacterium]|nr:hypothetical protein [Saprospiraceae bacterium]